ncbi:hypothetical protein Tco_0726945 [Tanacetum coccineum]|uniref:Uncharacterized protein n=1 Tax=Tanacetum coccineum TaxID=301880 RepID=A0ABQ4YH06_9ASTR
MSDAFDELEAELDQSIVDRKHDEIERKNLLIEHDNIITDARCLELEAELSNLRDNIHKDNYNELLNWFSNLEVNHLNLQLKYQNLKDSFQNKPSSSVNDTPDFNSVFVIGQMKASLQGKDNVKPNVLAPGKYAIDVEPIPPRNRNNREVHLHYLRHLKESVDTFSDIVESNVERPVFNQQDKKHAHTPRKKQVTFEDQIATSSSTTHKHVEPMHTQQSNVPVPPSTGVNSCTDASGSQPRSILKKHQIPPAKSDSMKKVEEHPRTIRSSLKTTNRVDSSNSSKRRTNRPLVFGLRLFKTYDGGSLKAHEFREKGNYVEGDWGYLFFVVQFCDSVLELPSDKHSCLFVIKRMVFELLKGSRGSNLYTISVEEMMKSSPICLLSKSRKQKSGLRQSRFKPLELRGNKGTKDQKKNGSSQQLQPQETSVPLKRLALSELLAKSSFHSFDNACSCCGVRGTGLLVSSGQGSFLAKITDGTDVQVPELSPKYKGRICTPALKTEQDGGVWKVEIQCGGFPVELAQAMAEFLVLDV